MLDLVLPKPIVLPGGFTAWYTPYHLWAFVDGCIIHIHGRGINNERNITRVAINDARIRFNENRSKLRLNHVKFAYGLIGGAVYVAPKVVIMLNTRNFDKYIVVR